MFDNDVKKADNTPRIDFSQAKDGSSYWVQTHAQRVSVVDMFSRWKEKSGSNLTVTSGKVGTDDKHGAGYRVFFHGGEQLTAPVKATVLATIRKNTTREGNPLREYILTFTGLVTDDDVIDAVMSINPPPQTITEASSACRLLWTGETPRQIEHCLQNYGKTFKKIKEEKQEENLRRDEELANRKADEARRLEQAKREEAEALRKVEREIIDQR